MTDRDELWQRAKCIGADPSLFDEPSGDEYRQRQRIAARLTRAGVYCGACPIRAACLERGLVEGLSGIHGGELLDAGRVVDVTARKTGPPLKPCGSEAAYRRHMRAGTEPCQPCKTAHADVAHDRAQRRRERTAA